MTGPEGGFPGWLSRHRWPISLVCLALLTRLPLLTISLDEVDTANFVNALTQGYNVPLLRPHPPGYPVYVFMGTGLNSILDDPLLALALLSATSGSLVIVPFYWLVRDFLGTGAAVVGSLFLIVNPLAWSFSEAALSDVPGMFFTVVLAWLCYAARTQSRAFLAACIVASLVIGIRQPNASLLPLLCFPLGYRLIVLKQFPGTLAAAGAALFSVTTAAWVLPMIFVGSTSVAHYVEAVDKQWSTAVSVYDIFHVLDPWFSNGLIRVERFLYGYLITYPWTGSDAKTPFSLLLSSPALFGFGLFIISFRVSSPRHVFVALWLASLVPTTLAIHFLPRYALPQVPGFLLACLMGYAFLVSTLLAHPRRRALLAVAGFGCALVLYGIKYQPPIATFEFTPPPGSVYPGMLVAWGGCVLLALGLVWRRVSGESAPAVGDLPASAFPRMPVAASVGLALLILVFGARGYTRAAVAHVEKSPNQRLVEFVKARFDTNQIITCWDNQTHSTFEALIPGTVPTGYWSAQDLFDAHDEGRVLLVTDRCPRLTEIEGAFALTEIGHFEGESPLWSKTPDVRLYAARRVP